ncbi:AMP-binding protein [Lentzea flaviverrucosa]|uniref:Acyl-CoA synthetase (AMP-forming)/AMP-acid ligase II n=1 Tax=Lentzea flaviverrucosa TaxID=200379 RepID=A0A1H9KNT3_9PSEU|nr:AMP-binding protein [Lentzea flaviverrucosa]RDI17929.1 acyl-CoA synthetase (AMP-forming)/AMP-acid ligase II [Lentzea flaviverrucosa]SER00513.1 Acyl-CoA synthetase (AMP-forming)/AMP-acid ligase II [Lentzea flaviverrucosa]
METGAEPVIYRSPLPAVAVPERTVPEHVLEHARHNDKLALVDAVTGESLTYAELALQVETTAKGLVRNGIRPGDTVAIVSGNRPRYAVGLHAVMAAGATAALINPMLTPPEIARLEELANVTTTLDLDDLPASASDEDSLPPGNPGSTAVVLFSSGTTGLTKAVGLSHRALVANLEQHRPGWRIDETDVLAANLPFFHVYGFAVILDSGLLGGATLVTMPRSDAGTYLRRLGEHRVTRAFLVPPLAAAIADHEGPVPELGLKLVLCGAAPLDDAVRREAERKLRAPVRQGYGLTEAGGTHQTFDDDVESDPASVGVLCPGTEARIVEPGTTTDAAVGEMLIRGPQVMDGYLGDEQATRDAFVDGWLRTGDLVRVHNGRFHVVDRIKEMIKYKGYQVAPAELEAVLRSHPAVRDAAVIGAPDRVNGEIPKAFVVTQGDVTADELMAFVAAEVAPYKKIRQVEFVREIPRSVSGKILRRLLKAPSQ